MTTNPPTIPGIDSVVENPKVPINSNIAINTDAVTRESNQQNITTRDRFLHLLAHGTLHLFGYDHKENTEAEVMEELEIKYLKDFNIRNPYTYEIWRRKTSVDSI